MQYRKVDIAQLYRQDKEVPRIRTRLSAAFECAQSRKSLANLKAGDTILVLGGEEVFARRIEISSVLIELK